MTCTRLPFPYSLRRGYGLIMPSKLERLITALNQLGGDPAVAEKHAPLMLIEWCMLRLVMPSSGHDIGGDHDGGFYARRRMKTAGLERELRDLGGKARKTVSGKLGVKEWMNAWAALPDRTQRLLWRPKLIQTTKSRTVRQLIQTLKSRTVDRNQLAGSFSAPGFHMIVPKPELVLPAVEIERERLKAKPGGQRRKRQRDEAERAATEVIRAAYQEATGNKGGRVIRNGRLVGRLHSLGHEIDGIFGTKLYAVKDSRRHR
jgi:hypothetical protein